MGFFDEIGKFFGNPLGYVERNVLKPIEKAVLRPIGGAIESGLSSITKTIDNVLRDPLPTLMQIGGSMIGIPPYVTAAAITAVKGGDIEDIAKAAAVSYATTQVMQSTQFGQDIQNYTSNQLSGDFTDYLVNNFNISADAAVMTANIARQSLTSAVSGGINAALTGKDIGTGITSGFTQGLVYAGTDSFFDDVNKDQNWGLSQTTLNLLKGATSSALNSAISGKGDPAVAIGNYITNAAFNQGKNIINKELKDAYNTFTIKQTGMENARAEYEAQEKAYKEQVDQYNSLVNQATQAKAEADKSAAILNIANQQAIDFYNLYLPRYNEKINELGQMGRDYDYYVSVGDIDNANRIANLYPFVKAEAETIKQHHLDHNNYLVTTVYPANFDRIYTQTKILQGEADKIYKNIAEPGQIDKGAYGFTDGGGEAGSIATWFPNIEDNLAAKLQKASENLNTAYDEYKEIGKTVEELSQKNIAQIAEIATRDATIDAVNQGLITATKIGDNKFALSNGMVLDNGEFYQNDKPLFSDVADASRNKLEFKDDQGGTVKYGGEGEYLGYMAAPEPAPVVVPGAENVADLVTGGGEATAGPVGITAKYVESMPDMQPRANETAGPVVEGEAGTYRRMISTKLPDGKEVEYEIIYDPQSENRKITYETVSGDEKTGFNIVNTRTRPTFDVEAGVSTDTSLPTEEKPGEDGTSDFGGVIVPGEGEGAAPTIPADTVTPPTDTTTTPGAPTTPTTPVTPTDPFAGPLTEEKVQRYNDEFARYLDSLKPGEKPSADYGVQDLGISPENWKSFNENLLKMQGEGKLPTQWRPNADGTFTYTGDDGDTITIKPDGTVVTYTEAPKGNLPGETPAPAPSAPSPPFTPTLPSPTPSPPAVRPRPSFGLPSLLLPTMAAGAASQPVTTAPIDDFQGIRATPVYEKLEEFKGPLDEFLSMVEKGSYISKPEQPKQQPQQTQVQPDRLDQPIGSMDMADYFNYGQQTSIEDALQIQPPMQQPTFRAGGMASPLMAASGGPLSVVHHSGKQRIDFRDGAAVNGPGDGQSDDIPAMLADGEFVFPADVVSALGNGSTKAGSDKLYEMMHSIRAHHRSSKPEDLPPPAKKSPLDYLKGRKVRS